MTIDTAVGIVSQGINVTILTSLPCIGLGLLVGLIIAVFQAVTQIQEQTLTFVPKMVVVFLMLSLTFPWMGQMVVNLSIELWENIPVIGLQGR